MHYPIDFDSEGNLFELRDRDHLDSGWRVFCHSYISSFEDAAYLLWALEVADPVMPEAGRWQPAVLEKLRAFPPYFRLRFGCANLARARRWDASCAFPFLDYVLSVYVDVFEQRLFPLFRARNLVSEMAEPMPEVEKLLDEALPKKYSGERSSIPDVISNSALLAMLEGTGFVVREEGRLAWTSGAARALRGPPTALLPQGVRIVDGRPRLVG